MEESNYRQQHGNNRVNVAFKNNSEILKPTKLSTKTRIELHVIILIQYTALTNYPQNCNKLVTIQNHETGLVQKRKKNR